MNNKEVAHLWANQSRKSARGSNFYFEGDTIYSYGSHFPIARHYKGVVLFNSGGYSKTTSKHKGYVRQAASHLTRFGVSKPMENPSGRDVREYGEQIQTLAVKAAKARNPANALESLELAVKEANSFCEHFKFKTRFSMPENLDELKAKAKASAERERKQKAERQAKFEAQCSVIVAEWLAGGSCQIPYQYSQTLLRRVLDYGDKQAGHVMQTSRGAIVPLSEAERAFRFAVVQRHRGWRRNGEQFKVGDYHLDAVNEQGVIAGCHRVAWNEIERFAATQGWL